MSCVRCQVRQRATFVWFCINMALISGVGTITFIGLLVCLSAGLSAYLHSACLHMCRHKAGCLLMTACLATCTLVNTVCLIFLSFVKIPSTSQPSKMILISWHQSPEPRACGILFHWTRQWRPYNEFPQLESPTIFNGTHQRYSGAWIGRRHHPVTLVQSVRTTVVQVGTQCNVTPLQISNWVRKGQMTGLSHTGLLGIRIQVLYSH